MSTTVANRAPLRRRGSSIDPLKNVTLRLRTRVSQAVRVAVDAGEAPSTDAFIEEAVVAALRERRRQRLVAAYVEAAEDPAFVADMDGTSRALSVAVGDGLESGR